MQSLHHPWTLGLATGSTSRTSFKGYVAQDAYFLKAFAQVRARRVLIGTSDCTVQQTRSFLRSEALVYIRLDAC